MIEIKDYSLEDIADDYPAMYEEVFGPMDPNHVPTYIFKVYDDDQYIGFLSTYYHDAMTMYIQRIGMPEVLRGKGLALKYMQAIIRYFRELGIRFLLGHVESSNIPTLLVALHAGWIINGVHTDTAGTVYVRIIYTMKEG